MGQKLMVAFLFALLLINLLFGDAIKPTGSGTEADPYQITEMENLLWVSQNDSVWGANYVQMNDINAAVTSEWDEGKGFLPIGDNHKVGNDWFDFKGIYDGSGYVIDSLYINREMDIVGLFGSTQGKGGAIRNLGLTSVNITGKDKVGGLCGKTRNHFLIENCYVTGNIKGAGIVGGLVGDLYNSAHIENCYTKDGLVNASNQAIGGFSGKVRWHATVSKCYTLMDVNCYAADYIGGFVGWCRDSSTTIEKCYSKNSVVAGSGRFAGGFAGVNQSKSKIINCYSMSSVSASSVKYGFCAYSDHDTIKNCYSAASSASDGFAKAFAGNTFIANFFDVESTGSTSGLGATGKTTAEMNTEATFAAAGWDFTNVWEMNGSSYPKLQDVYAPEVPDELPLPDGIELISNNYFNEGLSSWNFSAQGNAEATDSIDSSGALDGKNSSIVAITKQGDGKYNWEIEMSQHLPGGVKSGKMYHIQYQAKASKEAVLEIWIQQWHDAFDPIYSAEMSLTTDSKTFVDTFYVSEPDSNVVFAFVYGAMGEDLDVWVDDVHVIELTPQTSIKTTDLNLNKFTLDQNYPNPFNPTTAIDFILPKMADVQLTVYNVLGERVAMLVNSKMAAGKHSINFDAANLPSGIYFYRIKTDNFSQSKKMLLLK